MTRKEAEYVLKLLWERNGHGTTINLADGRVLNAINICWGQDLGEEFEHIYTNITPPIENQDWDFFLVSEIAEVMDENGVRIFKQAEMK